MAHKITIRGSISPAAGVLPRGEVKTVEWSKEWQSKIDKGYVDLIAESIDELTVTEHEADEQAQKARDELETEDPDDRVPADPPPRSGAGSGREDWAEFLAVHPHGFVTEGKDRSQLINEWDEFNELADAVDPSKEDGST